MTKGQFIRLFLSDDDQASGLKVIAAAKELTLHLSAQVENSSTKDTTGNFVENEITALSYDISTTSLVLSGDDSLITGAKHLASLEAMYDDDNLLAWQIANVSGTNNRTKGTVICSGKAYLTQLTINSANRQNATAQTTLKGYGEIVVGS